MDGLTHEINAFRSDFEESEEPDSNPAFDIDDYENGDYENEGSDDPFELETDSYLKYRLYLVAGTAHHQGLRLTSLTAVSPDVSSVRDHAIIEAAAALQHLQHLDVSLLIRNNLAARLLLDLTLR